MFIRGVSGELIPNHLALALVKAEMGRHPEATAFFLEGYPREARQVEDFEKQVCTTTGSQFAKNLFSNNSRCFPRPDSQLQ